MRENKIPFLGLCLGLQLAVVEFAKNVCSLENANSTEFDPETQYPVIDILPEQKKLIEGSKYGATMRLGSYPAVLKENTIVWNVYGRQKTITERHRHRFEVNPEFHQVLQEKGLVFSGLSQTENWLNLLSLKITHILLQHRHILNSNQDHLSPLLYLMVSSRPA